MNKTNLFELLGSPVQHISPHNGTVITAAPAGETYDDDDFVHSIADYGTYNTKQSYETYDDDGILPSVEDIGTTQTRRDHETFDDDAVLPVL